MGSSDRFKLRVSGRARSFGLAVAAVMALAGAGAEPATASTVGTGGGVLTYTAASGEANQTVISLSSGTYTVQDSGAHISAGAGCTMVNANKVTCGGAGVNSITVNAGDMNDVVWITAPTDSTINGGPGNDTLIGGAGNDTIDGGTGADNIYGGGGNDTVTYASRTAPVYVSLDNVANDGEAGEGDNVHDDVENVIGGAGSDSITGDASANVIIGNGGDDVLLGEPTDSTSFASGNDVIVGGDGNDAISGGNGDNLLIGGNGNDVIYGGPAANTIDAGPGNDQVFAVNDVADSINCGDGTDSVQADTFDVISPSCENVSFPNADTSGGSDSGSGLGCSSFRASASDAASGGGNLGGGLSGLDPCQADQSAVCAAVTVPRHASLRRGAVLVRVKLPDALAGTGLSCAGKLRIEVAAGKGGKAQRRRLVKIAAKAFSLDGGASKTLRLPIGRAGRRLLGGSRHTPARAIIIAAGSQAGSAPIVIDSTTH